jgi:GxxExxY protein
MTISEKITNKFAQEFDHVMERILGCAFKVSAEIGPGFPEKVYENALAHELKKSGDKTTQQFPIKVWYDGIVVGEYVADILVNESVLVELKAVKLLDPVHVSQCYSYLKGTKLKVCMLINFGKRKLEYRRLVSHF